MEGGNQIAQNAKENTMRSAQISLSKENTNDLPTQETFDVNANELDKYNILTGDSVGTMSPNQVGMYALFSTDNNQSLDKKQ